MMRLVIAVVAGFIFWTVLFLGNNAVISTAFPQYFNSDGSTGSTGMLALILALSVAFSIISGWVAGRIAQARAMSAGVVLGLILLAVGIFVQLQYWDVMPLWYHLSFLILLLPSTVLGARLSSRRRVAAALQ
ncbi:MAG: hypothetical protein WCD66_02765 [Rhodanobacteraceae bacterium]